MLFRKREAAAESVGPGRAPESDGAVIAKWIKEKTPEYETYLPTRFYAGSFWSRISGQVYLAMEDFEWAAQTLLELCERVEAGEWRGSIKSQGLY